MSAEQKIVPEIVLKVPEDLHPGSDARLPAITAELLDELSANGWRRIGLMVAFIDTDGGVMILEHNGRDKNLPGALGPLGETTQTSGPIIEQPMETLFRGIREELGVVQPARLDMWMYARGAWVINQWPRGIHYPDEFACAIAFPVFVPDHTKEYLLAITRSTEEIGGLGFISPDAVLALEEADLRQGTKEWLKQLHQAGLLTPHEHGDLEKVDFSEIYQSSLRDVEL